jgi:MYXO-CTERM domain-containing protein
MTPVTRQMRPKLEAAVALGALALGALTATSRRR